MAEEQIRVHDQPVPHIPSVQTSGTESENSCPRKDNAETNVDISNKRDEFDASNLHYEGNDCVYTDPVTKHQYIWDSKKNEWVLQLDGKAPPEDDSKEKSGEGALKFESEVQNNTTLEDKLCCPPEEENTWANDYEFDGESYFYKDLKTGITYKFDNAKRSWVVTHEDSAADNEELDNPDNENKDDNVIKQDMSSGTYGYEGDNPTYTDATDGTVYIWDRDKNAWFPKVDEDFLAHYQMNYGFSDSSTATSTDKITHTADTKENTGEQLTVKRKAGPQEPSWFDMDDQFNTKVYVSNLPLDITEEEFVDVMRKGGVVMRDPETGKMKMKLYTEPGTSQLKGDGLCTYIRVESVDLAVKLLDGYDLRGHKLHVERAKFQMKGNFDPRLKPKKQKKKEKERLKKMQEILLDWHPDKLRGTRSRHERVVIIKNLFDSATFDKNVSLLLEYQQDLREECSKCGDVKQLVIYDRHPDGVAQVTFREPEGADACVALLNGRWFGQRKITAETWDGKTKYKIAETDAEAQQRLQNWNKFLESGEIAAGCTAEENKGKVAVIEGNVTSANNARNGSVMSTDTDFELAEKRNEDNVDTLMEVKGEFEVGSSDNISAKSSSDVAVDGGSCAAKSDDVEGDRSEYEGNDGNRMVENG
jgi:HIV Tat-specific factor 1